MHGKRLASQWRALYLKNIKIEITPKLESAAAKITFCKGCDIAAQKQHHLTPQHHITRLPLARALYESDSMKIEMAALRFFGPVCMVERTAPKMYVARALGTRARFKKRNSNNNFYGISGDCVVLINFFS